MSRSRPFVIATRSSELALRQAKLVQSLLSGRGVESELKTYKTVGDKRLDVPLAEIGGKGLFTEELEKDLAAGRVDCCVHSLKDLPTEQPDGLMLGAILEREDPRDVLIVNSAIGESTLEELPRGTRVGTSSLRRRAQLLALRPDIDVVELRGNVPTRVRKVEDGRVHAAILAAAGVHRLGIHQSISSYLDAPGWLPAPGQGAIAIQVRADDDETRGIVSPLDHPETNVCVRAERAFLAGLQGGCQVPIGALAIRSDLAFALFGVIADVRGERVIRDRVEVGSDPEKAGQALAAVLREQGADDILSELRRETKIPSPQPE